MRVLALVLTGVLLLAAGPAGAVGFQSATAPDPDDRPLAIGIWYPSDAAVPDRPNTPVRQALALDGNIRGDHLPLVVISHGSGGWLGGHADLARTLAEAGFVVVAVTHTGNNYQDDSYPAARRMVDRPRHIARVLDYMLADWSGHDRLDPARIGIYGFSYGGYTALVAIGGTPSLSLLMQHCRQVPAEWVCKKRGPGISEVPRSDELPSPVFVHDPRIRAAVISAPGLGFAFDKAALASVTVPVQLWNGIEDDRVPVATNAEAIRQALPIPPDIHLVDGAGHFAFLQPCPPKLKELEPETWAMVCVDAPGFDRPAFHRQLNGDIAAFFRAQLGGDR
ncbi:alpha/beta hydrolase family protein [Inquilinus sp. OTU3971]|uniref:alpha/beta hydrolase family protein n=1 Tax=Inquilinus sp. OTU3971 TaxID=3043855 RepID=UPI00313E4370